jgi:predicted  nucleic acid-binding Zn-ribbon protein
MKELLQKLLKLQAVEFDKPAPKISAAEIAEIRASVPPTILGHYDRLVARGKRGVAIVRNQVCTGCHMRLPIGTINTLMQGTDIQLCDTCGRYLWLEETRETPVAEPVTPVKPALKGKKRKKLAHAAA